MESPDLGPPPIAHFDAGDPIKFDPAATTSASESSKRESEKEFPDLPPNLETRKKRRDSSRIVLDTEIMADVARSTEREVQSLKSGAKRKLSARDDVESAESGTKEPVPTHFSSKREGRDKKDAVAINPKAKEIDLSVTIKPARSEPPTRRALEPSKSMWMFPWSQD